MEPLVYAYKHTPLLLGILLLTTTLSCSKKKYDVPVSNEDISGISVNQWKFTADGKQYKGTINLAYQSPGLGLFFEGKTFNTGDTTILFHIGFPINEILKGYYNTTNLPNNSLFYMSDKNSIGIFDANPNTAVYGTVVFQVLSYNAANKEIKVKFSGNARYNYSSTSVISDGAFWSTLQ